MTTAIAGLPSAVPHGNNEDTRAFMEKRERDRGCMHAPSIV